MHPPGASVFPSEEHGRQRTATNKGMSDSQGDVGQPLFDSAQLAGRDKVPSSHDGAQGGVTGELSTPVVSIKPKPLPIIPSPTQLSMSQTELTTMVSFQSLLVQFSHPQVRADFACGVFGCNINPSLLPRIDQLRWTLLPRWQSGSVNTPNLRMAMAAQHWAHLVARSERLFLTDNEDAEQCLTYNEWFSTLDNIAADRYWGRVPAEKRCTHLLLDKDEIKATDDGESSLSGTEPQASLFGSESSRRKSRRQAIPMVKKETNNSLIKKSSTSCNNSQKQDQPNLKVDEIVISSSSPPLFDSSENEERSIVSRPAARHRQRRRRNRSSSSEDSRLLLPRHSSLPMVRRA